MELPKWLTATSGGMKSCKTRQNQHDSCFGRMIGEVMQRSCFTEVEERRALLLPQEIKALGPERQILLIEGMEHPVLARKIRYYRERRFRRRLLPPVQPPCASSAHPRSPGPA